MKIRRFVFAAILVALALSVASYAQNPNREQGTLLDNSDSPRANWWIASAHDTVGSVTWKLVAHGTYTRLVRTDTLRIIATADDTFKQHVTLFFINATDSSRVQKRVLLAGADTVFVPTYKARHLEYAVLDTECVGAVNIYAKTQAAAVAATIVPGQLQSYAAHHFTGRYPGGIKEWSVSRDTTAQVATSTWAQLRYYPNYGSSWTTVETGYRVLDEVAIPTGGYTRTFPVPIFVGRSSYVGVFVRSSSASVSAPRVKASIVGYDKQ